MINLNCITLFDGSTIDLINPTEEMISIQSIAHGISGINRFGSQSPIRYTVAEHSLGMVKMALYDGIEDKDILFAILMHDASEGYLGDVVSPLKRHLKKYKKIEARMNSVISSKFSVDFDKYHAIIKKYDRKIVKIEKKVLWGKQKVSDKLCMIKRPKKMFLSVFTSFQDWK